MALAVKPKQLKRLLPGAGLLGFLLRAVLYTTGMDGKGLLISGHWAETGLWLLTGAVVLCLYLCCRTITGPERYQSAFPASIFGASGSILAGVAIGLCGVGSDPEGTLGLAELVLRICAALSLFWVGFCRFTGRKPLFLCHSLVCLYLALRMVCQYRLWSTDPQLLNYCFYLGAYVALMLTAYQFAAFDADSGSHRYLWIWGLASVYFCIVSLAGSQEPFFLLCCCIWVFTNLSNLKRRRRKPDVASEGA